MTKNLSDKEIILDANNQPAGRLAAKIAMILMGKNKPAYLPYKITGDKVRVNNINNLKLTGNKEEQKLYYRHSQYQGGLKITQAKKLSKKDVLKKAVVGMLPKNRTRIQLMKRLIIE
jgi:large subunit ribosomal protein L13